MTIVENEATLKKHPNTAVPGGTVFGASKASNLFC